MEKWVVQGKQINALFLTEDIGAQVEIRWDYACPLVPGMAPEICQCGHPNCRRWILSKETANEV